MKRPFIAIATGLIALAAAACGLPEDIVGDSPTVTPGPNVTPTATEKPPTPAGTETVTPTSTPVVTVFTELEEQFNAAVAKWFETGYANYDFTYKALCECTEGVDYARVSVRNGQVVSAVDVRTGGEPRLPLEEFHTIDSLFDYIRAEIRGDTAQIEASFDRTTGAPLSAKFDRIVNPYAIDDELEFEVKDLEKVNVNTSVQNIIGPARAKWESTGLTTYDFTFRWNCFCIQDYTQLVRIQVRLGEIVGVTKAEEGSPIPQEEWERYETIDGLFALIQDGIDDDAASISAEYDDDLGFPNDVFIDYDHRIADEERGFEITDFEEADVNAAVRDELVAALAQWHSIGVTDHNFVLTHSCFCATVGPVRVEVRLGEIVSVTKVDDGSAVREEVWDRYATIDGLFVLIQDALDRDADLITAEFDDEIGFPTNVSIDYSFASIDEEFGFEVDDFAIVLTVAGG